MLDYLKKIWNTLTNFSNTNQQELKVTNDQLTQTNRLLSIMVNNQVDSSTLQKQFDDTISQILVELKAIHKLLDVKHPVSGKVLFGTPIHK